MAIWLHWDSLEETIHVVMYVTDIVPIVRLPLYHIEFPIVCWGRNEWQSLRSFEQHFLVIREGSRT